MSVPFFPSVTTASASDMPFVETIPYWTLSGVSAPGANVCLYMRVRVNRPIVTTTCRIFVGTASGNIDVGVSSLSGSATTKLASTGSTAMSGSSVVQSIALAFTWIPGVDYYPSIVLDNGTGTVGRILSTNAGLNTSESMSLFKASAFPIAAQSSVTSGNNVIAWMRFV